MEKNKEEDCISPPEREPLPKANLVETNNPEIFRDIVTGELYVFLKNDGSFDEPELVKLNDKRK